MHAQMPTFAHTGPTSTGAPNIPPGVGLQPSRAAQNPSRGPVGPNPTLTRKQKKAAMKAGTYQQAPASMQNIEVIPMDNHYASQAMPSYGAPLPPISMQGPPSQGPPSAPQGWMPQVQHMPVQSGRMPPPSQGPHSSMHYAPPPQSGAFSPGSQRLPPLQSQPPPSMRGQGKY